MKPEAYKLIEPDSAPTEPITLAEAKYQLKVDHDDDDDYITSLITAAREFCEEHTGRSFVPQTWQLGFAGWPQAKFWEWADFKPEFQLVRPPVFSVNHIKYRANGASSLTTLDASKYTFDPDVLPGIVRFKSSVTLPSLNEDYSAPVQVTITCGTSDESNTAAAIPARVKLAMKQMLTQFYDNRTPVVTGTIASSVPLTALDLLARYKIRKA